MKSFDVELNVATGINSLGKLSTIKKGSVTTQVLVKRVELPLSGDLSTPEGRTTARMTACLNNFNNAMDDLINGEPIGGTYPVELLA